jgi:hypothetical protein
MSDERDDDDRIEQLLGKRVLVGITYVDVDQQPIERRQLHGRIVRIDLIDGIVLALPNGEEYTLPPDLDALRSAEPGEYELSESGEVVVDPDYTSVWRISRTVH